MLRREPRGADVEGRLDELALGAPEIPLGEEEPLSGEGLDELQVGALDVVLVVVLEDVLDVVGVRRRGKLLGAETARQTTSRTAAPPPRGTAEDFPDARQGSDQRIAPVVRNCLGRGRG